MQHGILVLALTFNEAENLPLLITEIFKSIPEAHLLVIDDDSPDGTGRNAQKMAMSNSNLVVLIRQHRRGLGSALRDGLVYAIEGKYEYVLNLDADFSHDPADLPRLLKATKDVSPRVDVGIGSRYTEGGKIEGWSLRRQALSRLVNRFATLAFQLPVRDCSGAFRCYRVEKLKELNMSALYSNGYSIQEELLMELHKIGATMREIPITFVDRKRGRSKATFGEAVRSAWQLVQMALR